MSNEAAERHALTDGDQSAGCMCGDRHPVTFYIDLEHKATVERLSAAMQRHQDKNGRLPAHARYHCGGTCANDIARLLDIEGAR